MNAIAHLQVQPNLLVPMVLLGNFFDKENQKSWKTWEYLGAKEIRLFGQTYPVKASIEKIDGFSAHADHDGLLAWLSDIHIPPRRVFVTHGEEKAATSFAKILSEKTGWSVLVPEHKAEVVLD